MDRDLYEAIARGKGLKLRSLLGGRAMGCETPVVQDRHSKQGGVYWQTKKRLTLKVGDMSRMI
jgi:hypothetical protein